MEHHDLEVRVTSGRSTVVRAFSLLGVKTISSCDMWLWFSFILSMHVHKYMVICNDNIIETMIEFTVNILHKTSVSRNVCCVVRSPEF